MQPGDEARILQVKNWWFAVTCNVWVLFSEITILMIIMFSQPASLVYHKANEKSTALHDCETWAIESGPFDEITTWSHSVFCQVDDFQQRVPLTSTLEFTFLEGGHNKETSCDSHKTLLQWVWVADRQRVLHFNQESNWKCQIPIYKVPTEDLGCTGIHLPGTELSALLIRKFSIQHQRLVLASYYKFRGCH